MTMILDVVGGGSPGVTDMDVWVSCGAISQYESLDFDPPLGNSDGTVEADLGFVYWEGKFSGSERFSGTWSSSECEGSWNVKPDATDDDGGSFAVDDE